MKAANYDGILMSANRIDNIIIPNCTRTLE